MSGAELRGGKAPERLRVGKAAPRISFPTPSSSGAAAQGPLKHLSPEGMAAPLRFSAWLRFTAILLRPALRLEEAGLIPLCWAGL